METTELFNLYDSINTTAVRWLQYNSKMRKCPLGIKKFRRKNKIHMWLLMQLNFNSVYNNYERYYIDGSFLSYIYLRYIKKMKDLRYARKQEEYCLIEVNTFCDELVDAYNRQNPNSKIDTCIFEFIYDNYYGEKNNGS